MTNSDHVTIRFSGPQDTPAIAALAELDSARCPRGRLLLAEVAGELRAALAIDDGTAIADPFRHTSDLLRLLAFRRRQALAADRPRGLMRLAPRVRLGSAHAS